MESLEHVVALTRLGRFGDALQALEETKAVERGREFDVLQADLLERVGHAEQAWTLASALLKSKRLTESLRSKCEVIVGRILLDEGETEEGLAHLQRSALLAQQATDLHALFRAKLNQLLVMSDRFGPTAGSSVLADARQIATKLGDPTVTAQLHLFVAETEAKRGLLENAKRHTSLARRILLTCPNTYLEAFIGNLELAIAVLRSEFDDAKAYGFQAVKLAEESGAAKILRAVLGNMGNLFCELGEFDRATEYFERVLASPRPNRAHTAAVLESLARVQLFRGRADSCVDVLDRIESSVRVEQDRLFHAHRYAAHTRIRVLAGQGRVEDALSASDAVIDLAARAGDGLLLKQVQLTKAELLQRLGRVSLSMALIEEIMPGLVGVSPELYARGEQIIACALRSDGNAAGQDHYDRALRIYKALGSVPRQQELALCWKDPGAIHEHNKAAQGAADESDLERPDRVGARRSLHSLAMAFTQAARPDLVANELLQLLVDTGCVESAEISGVDSNPLDRVSGRRHLSVGFRGDREIKLIIHPRVGVESVASINAVKLLLASLHEVQRSRAEREERATLWPIEELPDDARAMISGRMRELMEQARRIARTKVNVLITGESGTGKEILARAIHDFSDRAGRPFVPFNCTAIPRDLLESQLFGHRRGAFTGADRDQLGLIRAAREGTLFLDEVGELGLDLQPKLLRFLESGEISPLGEPGSLTIDVRIVAATNANLEDAVRAGRFREDLFYRLNVVRLTIPPLRERRDEIPGFVNHFVARAADEFKKGQLRVAEETMERLLLYRWPGNVRQLQNEMRRMVALAEPDSTLLPHAISEEILGALPIFRHTPANGRELAVDLHDKLMPTIARIEGEMIKAALRKHDGRVDAVAKALGISRKGLYLKRQRLGL